MTNFYPLTIKDIRRETNDCVSIAFAIPTELQTVFNFTQGQYITLKKSLHGEELRRSYSICASPLDGELRIAVKKVSNGQFSTFANEVLKKGDELEVMPPLGKFFTPLNAASKKKYVAFASGSGITPILSIIKTTLLTETESSFTLVYGNKNRHSIIFKEALEALKNRFVGRLSIVYILSREKTDAPIHFGRIDEVKCKLLCNTLINPQNIDAFFLCGPEEMIFSVKDELEKTGVDPKKIHFELFTTSRKKQSISSHTPSSTNYEVKSKITVKQDGISFDFDLGFEGDSILDAALKNGADLPFACKGGVCCTCKAKLIEGEVEMDVHYGLEQEEIEHGFILTCQSHPITEKVVVDFDVK
jgi:ring-1,2-phenylacetyl-CoA epoxidase subunit PaaE